MTATTSRNTEMTAWLVLLGSLAVFLLLLFGIPYALVSYARQSTVAMKAEVESKDGAVMLESTAGVTQVLAAGQHRAEVSEGITVSTQADASAYVRLFDGSVLHLRPFTSVGLARMRQPRFEAGGERRRIGLVLAPNGPGPAVMTVGSTFGDLAFDVATPHGEVALAPQSQARLELSAESLKVTGGEGTVTVRAQGRSVPLGFDQRTVVAAGEAPAPPMEALENLVQNPGFDQPLDAGGPWRLQYYPPLGSARVPGSAVAGRTDDGRRVARFVRRESNGSPGDLYFEQELDADVTEADHLGLTAELRVLFQDLPGGGTRLTEFPVLVTLIAQDEEDTDFEWTAGFYARPPDASDPNTPQPGPPHQAVPEGAWYAFDSGNLLDGDNPNGFARLGLPRPARLKRLLVKASGHDYVSEVDEVGVWVK